MTTDCDFTQLPSDSCAHCSGGEKRKTEAQIAGDVFLSFMDGDLDFDTAFAELKELDNRKHLDDFFRLLEALRGGKENPLVLEIQTEYQRVTSPGRWNRTKETYGGHDGQVDHLDIERTDI